MIAKGTPPEVNEPGLHFAKPSILTYIHRVGIGYDYIIVDINYQLSVIIIVLPKSVIMKIIFSNVN